MQLQEVFQKTVEHFRKKGLPTARLDGELLLAHALGWDRMQVYLKFDYPLAPDELAKCRDVVQRRSQGEPVAYICGQRGFYKHQFSVRPGVLIPRPETELIVEKALQICPDSTIENRIIEFGVGSGCLGLSILAERPRAHLLAFDLSPLAIEVSQLNAQSLKLSERVCCLVQDVAHINEALVLKELGGRADLIVANPPYIASGDPLVESSVARYEPAEALYAEENGLAKIRQWAKQAERFLRPGGTVIFEIGYNQSEAAKQFFAQAGLINIEAGKDLAGLDRWVVGQKQSMAQ